MFSDSPGESSVQPSLGTSAGGSDLRQDWICWFRSADMQVPLWL